MRKVYAFELEPEILQTLAVRYYFAGLFDGEGHVRISSSKGSKNSKKTYHSLQATLVNTNKEVLEVAHQLYGGSFRERKQVGSWRPCWTLTFQGSEARQFLGDIESASIIKREEIQLGLEFFDKHSHPGTHGPQHKITDEEFESMANYKQRLEGIRNDKFLKEGMTSPVRRSPSDVS